MSLVPYVIEQTSRGELFSCDIYSRLLKGQNYIFGEEVTDASASVAIAQPFSWKQRIRKRIFICTLTARADLYLPVWQSMIPCRISNVILRQSVSVWKQAWDHSFGPEVQKGKRLPFKFRDYDSSAIWRSQVRQLKIQIATEIIP